VCVYWRVGVSLSVSPPRDQDFPFVCHSPGSVACPRGWAKFGVGRVQCARFVILCFHPQSEDCRTKCCAAAFVVGRPNIFQTRGLPNIVYLDVRLSGRESPPELGPAIRQGIAAHRTQKFGFSAIWKARIGPTYLQPSHTQLRIMETGLRADRTRRLEVSHSLFWSPADPRRTHQLRHSPVSTQVKSCLV
jgi:hypothetical protein